MTAYSNRLDLASSLVTVLDQLRQAQADTATTADSVRSTGRSARQWRVSDRLSEADMRLLVEAFESGIPKWKLAEQYGVSESSVKRLVRRHRQQQAAQLASA
ncbi:hypothetical protein ACIRG5_44575 [Lentzea sp. NPDC102401]|uniref:hypothetical protein n=1 Tax=Lentzea sp. NPDC102401 TaxID=3364128 RepID=UPI0037FD89CD